MSILDEATNVADAAWERDAEAEALDALGLVLMELTHRTALWGVFGVTELAAALRSGVNVDQARRLYIARITYYLEAVKALDAALSAMPDEAPL